MSNNMELGEARKALKRSIAYLLSRQNEEGYWEGELVSDTSSTACYILLMHYLKRADETRQAKAARHILNEQQSDGSWNAYPDGPGSLDITVLNYLALKLAGSAEDGVLQKARHFILAQGGGEAASNLPSIMLALFGQVPWKALPPFNTSLMFFESLLYRLGYSHTVLIPLLVIRENYCKIKLPAEKSVREIFLRDPWLGIAERPPRKSGCQAKALAWILERQEQDGSWGGYSPKASSLCWLWRPPETLTMH